jgi:small subunit ribosomal protein S1
MIEKQNADFFDKDGNFDWDGYESTCPKVLRTPNPHIKVVNDKHKVYSREPYAQEMYNKMVGHIEENDIITHISYGNAYDGKVFAVTDTSASIDIGYRQLVYVNLEKEDDEFKDMQPGDEVSVIITSLMEDDRKHIMGSVSEGTKQATFQEMLEAIKDQSTAWVGTVKRMLDAAGYMISVKGIECFMPGSLAGINKLYDFESIVGQEIYVVPVSFSKERKTMVVSHRAYLKTLIPESIENLKENLMQEIVGTVTGSAKYGVFCEFSKCLTGMIHVNDLDGDTLVRHKNREIQPGEEIKFKVKDIISDTKITLTQREDVEINPWLEINKKFKVPSEVNATIKSCKDYGLFVELEQGVVGLLHVSEIGEDKIKEYKPKQTINVLITKIEEDTKKIFLKLPQE